MRFAAVLVGLSMLQTLQCLRAGELITLMYNERPPYRLTLPDGQVGGTTALAAAAAFQRAGVAFSWQEVPAARQWAIVEQNLGKACAVGFQRTPERERVALFTLPIDRETAFVAVSSRQVPIPDRISLDDLIASPDYTIQAKKAKSYGPLLNEKFAQIASRIDWTALDLESSIRMIHGNRPIIVFMTESELEYFMAKEEFRGDDFRVQRFAELSTREPLHLMCTKSVGPELIDRLNRALSER